MNNTAILLKCISELEAEEPRLDFVLGALATLVEMQGSYTLETDTFKMPASVVKTPLNVLMPKEEPTKDEGALLDAQAKASMETIKALADKSLE